MRTEWNENQGVLVGEVVGEPEFSHENHGEDYFRVLLRVPRLSGTDDRLHLMVSRTLLEGCPVQDGSWVRAEGEVRSHNNRTGQGSRLQIFLFVKGLEETQSLPENHLLLSGVICRATNYRRTPLGREICDLLLAVNRKYGRADYLPCIAWGSLARQCAGMDAGDGLHLSGRLQSRTYIKVIDGVEEERTAFEVSIMEMTQVDLQKMQEIPPENREAGENSGQIPSF
jgi:single-stranded DNA-binding protein